MKKEASFMKKILEVNHLSVSFDTYAGEVQAIRDVAFDLQEQETLAIVGESGSGKSVTAQSIMRLIPMPPGKFAGGEMLLACEGVVAKAEQGMASTRGTELGMIFQDPLASLNATMRIGKQIAGGLVKHQGMSKKEARERGIELLKL